MFIYLHRVAGVILFQYLGVGTYFYMIDGSLSIIVI